VPAPRCLCPALCIALFFTPYLHAQTSSLDKIVPNRYIVVYRNAFVGERFSIHSGPLDGLPTADAKAEITRLLEAQKLGKKTVNYKLRDWLFSRQRYWGEPFPILQELDASGKQTGPIRKMQIHQ
jgi:leucyl-tRNA synthetase